MKFSNLRWKKNLCALSGTGLDVGAFVWLWRYSADRNAC